MCTVTLVQLRSGSAPNPKMRLVCNRDELRTRPRSLPVETRRADDVVIVMPVDPVSGGSWIGLNNHGLVACLLNATPAYAAHDCFSRATRGTIVPSLLQLHSLEEALDAASRLEAHAHPPFRVLVHDPIRFLVISSDGSALSLSEARLHHEPLLLTSSGLGDHHAEAARRPLFHQMMTAVSDPTRPQDQFHAHRGEDQPELSVRMARADARTVSVTVVELHDTFGRMTHTMLGDDLLPEGTPTNTRLSLCCTEPAG